MARLKTEIVVAREAFAKEKFAQGWGVNQVQDALVHEGPGGLKGVKMALPRLQGLREEAKGKPVPVIKEKPQPKVTSKPTEKMIQAVCEVGDCNVSFLRPASLFGEKPVCPDCFHQNRKVA